MRDEWVMILESAAHQNALLVRFRKIQAWIHPTRVVKQLIKLNYLDSYLKWKPKRKMQNLMKLTCRRTYMIKYLLGSRTAGSTLCCSPTVLSFVKRRALVSGRSWFQLYQTFIKTDFYQCLWRCTNCSVMSGQHIFPLHKFKRCSDGDGFCLEPYVNVMCWISAHKFHLTETTFNNC